MCAMQSGWPPLALVISPADYISAYSSSSPITAGPATAVVTGGSGTFIYYWQQLSGDGMTITNPVAASTSFTATGLGFGFSKEGNFQVTVTDTVTSQSIAAEVYVYVERT